MSDTLSENSGWI